MLIPEKNSTKTMAIVFHLLREGGAQGGQVSAGHALATLPRPSGPVAVVGVEAPAGWLVAAPSPPPSPPPATIGAWLLASGCMPEPPGGGFAPS